MSEEQLCKSINSALFQNGSSKTNKWLTIKLVDGENIAIFEAIVPSKGNIKVRKPIKRIEENVYEYIVYRITKHNTLHDMGLFEGVRPEEEVINYECV